jgi:putative glutamine amidotransferase
MSDPIATIAVAPARTMDDYRDALRVAGITSHELDYTRDEPEAILGRVGGLMLLGGGDIDPARYGQAPHAATEVVPAPRDQYEIALVKEAIARDLPIFAICRGIQLLNVALGGTLIQDIPTQVDAHLEHQPAGPPASIGHFIEIVPISRLATLLDGEIDQNGFCAVNSRHHQCVDALGDGLKPTARAADGIIEAVERPASRFCVGVQWHPENFWRTGRFRGLFTGFLAAARETPVG